MQLPRIDVGYSGFVAAVVALALIGFDAATGTAVNFAAVPELAVIVAMFVLGYLVPRMKEYAAGIAGALVVIVQAIVSARSGGVVDSALLGTAFTYLVNLVLIFALPRLQPEGDGTSATVDQR